jgi:hypothetical protein
MTTWSVRVWNVVRRTGRAIRYAWLGTGIALATLLVLEGLYRFQGAIRRLGRESIAAAPESTAPWMREYLAEERRSQSLAWRPYVYFRRVPFAGHFITVDSAGRRVTVQSPTRAGAPEVFLFGGSTLFGTFQRDSATIPSLLAGELRDRFNVTAHVTNFGETGYVFTQEVLELFLQLRDGVTPRVVIFYDGINDVAAAVQNGRAGLPMNEANRARDFRFGRTVFSWESDLGAQARAFTALGWASVNRLQLMQRLLPHDAGGSAHLPPVHDLADSVITSYEHTVRRVEAWAKTEGFVPLYVWQPSLHATHKALTPGEQQFRDHMEHDGQQRYLRALHDTIALRIDAAVRPLVGARFLNLARVFDTVSVPVFADDLGHIYEGANTLVVRALAPSVAQALRPRRPGTQGM